jgi:hypothetical protein
LQYSTNERVALIIGGSNPLLTINIKIKIKGNTMSKNLIVGIVIVVSLALTGVIIGSVAVGWNNQAIELESSFEAQVKANESTYDKMWKVISKKANVANKYSEDFKSSFSSIMQGRYGESQNRQQAMFNWIKEQNPSFDASLLKGLSASIEGLHNEFDMAQKRMISIKQSHQNLRKKFPSSLIVGSRDELVLKMVTSTRTDKVFKSGKDDDVSVF